MPLPRSQIPVGSAPDRLDSCDWSATGLGTPSAWPPAMRASFDVAMAVGSPLCLAWGVRLLALPNDAFLSLLGMSWSAAAGQPLPELLPGFWRSIEPLAAGALSGKAGSAENLPLAADGAAPAIPVGIALSPVRDGSGTVAGLLCALSSRPRDVPQPGASEARVAFQAVLLDAVEQAVVATDLDGRITYCNRFAETLYGRPAAEAIGRPVTDLVAWHDPARTASILAYLAKGERWSGEFPGLRRDGSTFAGYVTNAPVRDAAGRPVGIVGVSHDITERKRAEAQLREKTALLEATLDIMDQGLIVADAQDRVALFNRRALDLLDLPRSLMERHPHTQEVFQHQARAGEFGPFETIDPGLPRNCGFHGDLLAYERMRPGGTVLEVRTVCQPDGLAVRTFTDITARKRTERGLRESDELYRALVNATPAILWRAGPEGLIFSIDSFGRDTGGRDDLKGRSWLDLIHPEDREEACARWQALAVAGESGEMEFRLQRPGRDLEWVRCRMAPLKDEAGGVREWVGSFTDITQGKQSEALLLLRDRALNAIAQGVMVLDAGRPQKPIIYVNPAFERLTGYRAGEAVGQQAGFLEGPDTDRQDAARVRAALDQGHGIQVALVNHRKDGTPFLNELTIAPVADERGRITHYVGVQSDVTARDRLEKQLRQSQKMEAVGQLTGGIAHDFNNLLTVILGNSEVLTEDPSDPALTATLAGMILDAAERGAELTRQLLAFARRQVLKPERLNVQGVVGGMMPLLQRATGEHVELRTVFSPEPAVALADRAQFESAILNLVVNARDAMPRGGTITIRTGSRTAGPDDGQLPAGQPVVFVEVADTGCGMPPEVLARVFEPFFTTKEPGKGTGLGMAMIYGFAQQSGGHVAIASEVGQGTRVTILLLPAGTPEPERPRPKPAATVSGAGKRVLLVEDEQAVRHYLSSQLRGLGFTVVEAGTARDGLKKLQAGPPFDLVVSDVVLPGGMSGIELARLARSAWAGLRIVLASGYPEEAFEQHGRPPEGVPLLRKPFKRRDLFEVLRQVMGE